MTATLKPQSQFKLVGTPQRRIDALDIVTGRKQFAMDLEVPGALPTMVCRPPTINGTARRRATTSPRSWRCPASPTSRSSRTRASSPAASRSAPRRSASASTRSDALDVTWGAGTVDGKSDADVLAELQAAELPLTPRRRC